MKPSLVFRIQRFVYFLFKGRRLAWHHWYPNYHGYIYRGQIYQARRFLHSGKHQYHVRFYDDGLVTGHFEITPEYDVSDHLSGVDLRTLFPAEAERLKGQLE